jgi:ribosome-binding protein aMBF1 (putative translation factor)
MRDPPNRPRRAFVSRRRQVHVIQGFESGRVVPSNALVARMERLLGTKLPRVRAPRAAAAVEDAATP